MKKAAIYILVIGIFASLAVYALSTANGASKDPNIPDPNRIKLPEGTKMPIRLKCPVHGMIGNGFITIETDAGTKVYCSRCAKDLVARFFDMNLPELEVVK